MKVKAMEKEKQHDQTGDDDSSIEKLLRDREKLDAHLKDKFSRDVTVMFTDIKGSTTFFEIYGDIEGRLMLQKHHEMLFPLITKHRGRVIKTIGDAIMASFDEPVEAVRAAVEMQQRLFDYNKSKKEKKNQLHIRIGINTGEGLVEKSDIYGDVVNVAARVESLAAPDEILVSVSVYDRAGEIGDIQFQHTQETKIKGKEDSVKLYRVVWAEQESRNGMIRSAEAAQKAAPADGSDAPAFGMHLVQDRPPADVSGDATRGGDTQLKTLELEITSETNSLKFCMVKKGLEEKETLRHYEEKKFDHDDVDLKCREIVRLLNNANLRGSLAGETLQQLKGVGFALFEDLLPHEAQKVLSATTLSNLILTIDDSLLHIPWELLYDGNNFLCRKFNVGRVVRTRQKIVRPRLEKLSRPVKMLILCDPRGDLKSAYDEGFRVQTELDTHAEAVHADLMHRRVDSSMLRGYIRNYDIIHYAGHADYNSDNPAESGWLIEKGKFTSSDIMQLSRNMPFPALIFSNACKTGVTQAWRLDDGFQSRIYGLAHAFLVSGVQHYLGTFWEVLDEVSCEFSVSFYHNLVKGEPIGCAVKKAREHLIARYGEGNIIWACYVLYGHPDFTYFSAPQVEPHAGAAADDRESSDAPIADSQELRAQPAARSRWSRIYLSVGAVAAAALIAALGWLAFKGVAPPPPETSGHRAAGAVADTEKSREHMQAVLKALSDKYRDQLAGGGKPDSSLPSAPVSLSVIGFTSTGRVGEHKELEEYFMAKLSQEIVSGGRVRMVEREKLSEILDELKLSTSDIAGQDTAMVMLGRLLGAQLIGSGKIINLRGETTVSLRVFETATSQIVISVSENLKKDNSEEIIQKLSRSLTQQLEKRYPPKEKRAAVSQ